jgi:hypothetical protein
LVAEFPLAALPSSLAGALAPQVAPLESVVALPLSVALLESAVALLLRVAPLESAVALLLRVAPLGELALVAVLVLTSQAGEIPFLQ